MLSDRHFKNIYCQCALSLKATGECALPNQGNEPRKKTKDGTKDIEDLTHSQSEGNPQDDNDRIAQEDSCVSGPGSNQPGLEQQETEGPRSMSLKQR